MKKRELVFGFVFLLKFIASAQSPYLSVRLRMDSIAREYTNYRISMKICEPLKMTERGDWFKPDTSSIDFLTLKTSDISCGHYSYIEGKDDYAGSGTKFNIYEFGNQIFAWEKILVFRITDYSSRGWNPEMYIVMPMKYKSLVTYINLNDLEYQSGKVIFLAGFNASQKGKYLIIEQSLKDHKTEEIKNYPLEELLEAK